MKKQLLVLAVSASIVTGVQAQSGRDTINIVGSSTVFPFATVVAETFGKKTSFKTPKIESTGSGGGMKLFCNGVGLDTPDITNASRAMKSSEFKKCEKNGVTDITEVHIGFDGIAIANSNTADQLSLTRKELFLALAAEVPSTDGSSLVKNPYTSWKQINANLPDVGIEVLGPPPTSGTRDAFVELVMEEACDEFPVIASLKDSNKKQHKAVCATVREDGPYVEAGENDNLIIQKLSRNPAALGIFGYSFLEQNDDKVQGSLIEGVAPEFETIADGSYPVSRPLFFYVKNQHVGSVPGIKEFLQEFTSEMAMGEDGYLLDKGLIPLSESERETLRSDVMAGKKHSM